MFLQHSPALEEGRHVLNELVRQLLNGCVESGCVNRMAIRLLGISADDTFCFSHLWRS